MVVTFDSLKRFEAPPITLCNPGASYDNGVIANSIGILPDITDMEMVFNFNAPTELNFCMHRIDRDGQEYNNLDLYDDITAGIAEQEDAVNYVYDTIEELNDILSLNSPQGEHGDRRIDFGGIGFVTASTLYASGWEVPEALSDYKEMLVIADMYVSGSTPDVGIVLNPIKSDGTVLTPKELFSYYRTISFGAMTEEDVIAADRDKLVLKVLTGTHAEVETAYNAFLSELYGYAGEITAKALELGVATRKFPDRLAEAAKSISDMSAEAAGNRGLTAIGVRHNYDMFKALQIRRLLFLDKFGFFIVSSVEDNYDSEHRFKDVHAVSIETELEQRALPYIENGTYRFVTDTITGEEGLLNKIMDTVPNWTVGEVNISDNNMYRTFEDVDTSLNCLGFLMNNMQEAYECIFLFDGINRKVNVYDQNSYSKDTDIQLSRDDVINTVDITENSDNLYTALTVVGADNEMISSVNPIGANTIYDFSHYLSWMTPRLATKVKRWQDEVAALEEDYYTQNLAVSGKRDIYDGYMFEAQRFEIQKSLYVKCRNNIIAESSTASVEDYNAVIKDNGGKTIRVYQEVEETVAEIDRLIEECQASIDDNTRLAKEVKLDIDSISENIEAIQDSVSFENYFTKTERNELFYYIFEGSYKDEYVKITDIMTHKEEMQQMNEMYSRAKKQLKLVSQPTQEFDVGVENFLFAKEFIQWSEQIETGCVITVENDDYEYVPLMLTSMEVNYDDHTLNLKFGTRYIRTDTKSMFDKVLGDVSKSANTLSYIKDMVTPIKNGELNSMKAALQSARDLTMADAISSVNEEVIIDGSGYTGRKKLNDGTYDPRQIKITGRSIVFTDDEWQSSKTAVGEIHMGDGESVYGINAQAIIGDLIMGNNLKILDNNGNELLSAVDGKISAATGDINGAITEMKQTADGLELRIQQVEKSETDHVVTSTGYRFDSDGLNIYKAGDEIHNKIDNTGMFVTRTYAGDEEDVLVADQEGVNALNLTARQYLIVGTSSRFEDYINSEYEKRTACFFIG